MIADSKTDSTCSVCRNKKIVYWDFLNNSSIVSNG